MLSPLEVCIGFQIAMLPQPEAAQNDPGFDMSGLSDDVNF
jgi:hypothetical protein